MEEREQIQLWVEVLLVALMQLKTADGKHVALPSRQKRGVLYAAVEALTALELREARLRAAA